MLFGEAVVMMSMSAPWESVGTDQEGCGSRLCVRGRVRRDLWLSPRRAGLVTTARTLTGTVAGWARGLPNQLVVELRLDKVREEEETRCVLDC